MLRTRTRQDFVNARQTLYQQLYPQTSSVSAVCLRNWQDGSVGTSICCSGLMTKFDLCKVVHCPLSGYVGCMHARTHKILIKQSTVHGSICLKLQHLGGRIIRNHRVSLSSSEYPETQYIDQASCKLREFHLPLPPRYLD